MNRLRDAWEDLGQRDQEPVPAPTTAARLATSPEDQAVERRAVQPALERIAELRYGGRLDLVTDREQGEVVGSVVATTGLHRERVDAAVSGVVLEAQLARERAEIQRPRLAAGDRHAAEFEFEREDGPLWRYRHLPTGREVHLDEQGRFHQVVSNGRSVPITTDQVLDSYRSAPAEAAGRQDPDHRRMWQPLEEAVGFAGADEFRFYGSRGDVQVYGREVHDSKQTIGIDSKGRFYDVETEQSPVRISREEALHRVDQPAHFFTPPEKEPTLELAARSPDHPPQEHRLRATVTEPEISIGL